MNAGCGSPDSLTGILIRLGPPALVWLPSAAQPLSMALPVTGLVGWAIRICADHCGQRAEHARRPLPRTCRMAGMPADLSPDRSGQGLAKAIKDIPGGSRRAMGRYRYLSRAIPATARSSPGNGGHPRDALRRTAVAVCAVICVQLDPVRHRPTACTKLRMIAAP